MDKQWSSHAVVVPYHTVPPEQRRISVPHECVHLPHYPHIVDVYCVMNVMNVTVVCDIWDPRLSDVDMLCCRDWGDVVMGGGGWLYHQTLRRMAPYLGKLLWACVF